MRMYDIIHKKRNGEALTDDEIRYFVKGYTDGSIPDYQASALAMAIMFVGMTDAETAALTLSMAESGDTVDLTMFGDLSVDKHSTGGVGDKTTLIVTPIVASLGAKVAKMSGRGLGHTGGTVDKLESISGYKTSLTREEFFKQVEDIGIAVIGQTGNLAPCDKKLYALRDVTATVESIPLITSSIMSKKIAAGTHSIVLDVKCGSGAFMKNIDDAVSLGKAMIDIAKRYGRRARALVTNMDVPLGYAIGNRTEVWEAIQVLKGKGEKRLTDLCVSLAVNMVSLALNIDTESAKASVLEAISSGKALEKMKEWIKYQGGDISFIENEEKLLYAEKKKEYKATKDGYISKIHAEELGKASMLLGAGREKLGDTIDFTAGILLSKSYGEYVKAGDTVCTLYTSSKDFAQSEKILDGAIEYSEQPVEAQKLIYKII